MFGMDIQELLVVGIIIFLVGSWIGKLKIGDILASIVGRPKPKKKEEPMDMMGEIIKAKKLVARQNKRRPGLGKKLLFEGDGDVPRKLIKYQGIIFDTTCTLFFIKDAWYKISRPLVVPTCLIADFQARYIRIKARGYDRLAGPFLRLTYNNIVDEDLRKDYHERVTRYVMEWINIEGAIRSQENRLNSIAVDSHTDSYPRDMLEFMDHNPSNSGIEYSEGGE